MPGSSDPVKGIAKRYPQDERWTGLLQSKLGPKFHIIEDGLNGRTIANDDSIAKKPYRNGLRQLTISFETHYPIDLIIIMLGSNDVKIQYLLSADAKAENMQQFIKAIKNSCAGIDGDSPKILIIAPQPLIKSGLSDQFDNESIIKSENLASLYKAIANEEECEFIDAGKYIASSKIDGLHLEKNQLEILAEVITNFIVELYSA